MGYDGRVSNYYQLLSLEPTASVQQIRRAYRDLSKRYHPDTTELPSAIATQKFQQLNEAYATLSNPERRLAYDHQIGYSRISVIQIPENFNRSVRSHQLGRSSAYLDPTDRPLSAGELFALFILGVTFAVCLVLVLAMGLTQGELVPSHLQGSSPQVSSPQVSSPLPANPDAPPALPSPSFAPSL